MGIKQQKTILRMQMQLRRKKTNKEIVTQASEKICRKVLLLPDVQNTVTVFTYVSFGNEVATHELITKLLTLGKTVCVPKIVDEKIIPVHICSLNELRAGKNKILEPVHAEAYDKTIDLALVPGVAFTKDGARLGMGGGFYDRFLSKHTKTTSIALAFHWQIVPIVPEEQHDQRLNKVITEQQNFPHK